jgi:hypothetical protein
MAHYDSQPEMDVTSPATVSFFCQCSDAKGLEWIYFGGCCYVYTFDLHGILCCAVFDTNPVHTARKYMECCWTNNCKRDTDRYYSYYSGNEDG